MRPTEENEKISNEPIEGMGRDKELMSLPIGKEEIIGAGKTLKKYKEGKANLEKRIIDNEQWWKMRHVDEKRKTQKDEETSGWLFNCIISKHADAMNAYPTFNCLPREAGDKQEAEKLSSILPVILEQNGFEQVYSDEKWDNLKNGTGIYGIFWNKNLLNGLGDIDIKNIDILNIFWEPGITNIQDSRNVFVVELVDTDILKKQYPECRDIESSTSDVVAQYIYDDTVDTTNKSVVVDWYYKKREKGKSVLHYCKYVNDIVLYSTENDMEVPTAIQLMPDEFGNVVPAEIPTGKSMAEVGWYNHGLYPFVFDTLYQIKGSPCGLGYIDVCKHTQTQIDRLDRAIIENAEVSARPRWFLRNDGSVNEAEYADYSNPFIHVDGNMGSDSIQQVQSVPLSAVYPNIKQYKIEELKEISGNRDVANGGTTSGVTAASAIAAMQEQAGKLSKDATKTSYRAYVLVIKQCIELIRQFYDIPRQFRILGQYGMEEFVPYSNEGLKPQSLGNMFGQDMGYREAVFDIEVSAQSESPYSKISQNELALQFYSAGFFNPQLADQAIACIEMMDFPRKDGILQKIAKNQTLQMQNEQLKQVVLQLAQMVDRVNGTNLAQNMAMKMQMESGEIQGGMVNPEMAETNGLGQLRGSEHSFVEKARQQAQNAGVPN